MKTIAIVQARMGSTRLPKKILMDIEGKPALWHQIKRMQQSKLADRVIVATTTSPSDDLVYKFCIENKFDCFRGREEDVLDRYYRAACHYGATEGDAIIRVTGDCPLVCPIVMDKVIKTFIDNINKVDYVSNNHPATYPDGLDTEVFSFQALETAWREAELLSEREHVTPYITKNENMFKKLNVKDDIDLSHYRWTLDEDKDYEFFSAVFKHLYKEGEIFTTAQVLELLERNPEIAQINSLIIRDEGYLKSLQQDKIFEKDD